jgi:hypothetical protein
MCCPHFRGQLDSLSCVVILLLLSSPPGQALNRWFFPLRIFCSLPGALVDLFTRCRTAAQNYFDFRSSFSSNRSARLGLESLSARSVLCPKFIFLDSFLAGLLSRWERCVRAISLSRYRARPGLRLARWPVFRSPGQISRRQERLSCCVSSCCLIRSRRFECTGWGSPRSVFRFSAEERAQFFFLDFLCCR